MNLLSRNYRRIPERRINIDMSELENEPAIMMTTSQKASRTAFRGALFCASMDTNFVLPGDIISYAFFFNIY